MKKLFEHTSIKRGLLLIGLLTNGLAVLVLSAALGIGEWMSYRERAVTTLKTYAGVVAGNVAPAMLFDDDKAAHEVLQRLIVEPSIVHAAIEDRNAKTLARLKLPAGSAEAAPRPPPGEPLFVANRLTLAHEVRHEGEPLGTLYLQSDLGRFQRELFEKLALIAAAMGVALMLSLFLFIRLQKTISAPLRRLAEGMDRVTRDIDYRAHVPASGSEEIRMLADGFNKMLDAIHERETALAEHRNKLEETVRQRTEELRQLNASLERRVGEEAARSREKDHLLIRQSRLATLGEMIGNIAHQWRQPLNALALLLTNLKDAQRYNELDQSYVDATADKGQHLIGAMSATIDDFRNLFKPERDKTRFDVSEAVREALAVVEGSFRNANIETVVETRDHPMCDGFFNEYTHVVLNILGNARDAIRDNRIGNGRVTVTVGSEEGRAVVAIRDNGGGIPPSVMERIFDPYFTTREKGTGIGLYMSLMIIEKNMDGYIDTVNIGDGAEFRIITPLAEAKEEAA